MNQPINQSLEMLDTYIQNMIYKMLLDLPECTAQSTAAPNFHPEKMSKLSLNVLA